MHGFSYHRPRTIDDAVGLLSTGEQATLIAGGMTLLPTLKFRLAEPDVLVDLDGVDGLRGIASRKGGVEIGAMTTHAELASSDTVRGALPALAAMAAGIGDPQVRNRGTLGGSIANNDPAADYPAAVLALAATVITNRREIAADDFFLGLFETALEPDEIVVRLRFPVPARAAYAKFRNPASRYAIAGVMVAEGAGGVRVAVTGAGPGVFRIAGMETALASRFAVDSIDGIVVDADGLGTDLHAGPAYRAHLVAVMARRAVAAAGG